MSSSQPSSPGSRQSINTSNKDDSTTKLSTASTIPDQLKNKTKEAHFGEGNLNRPVVERASKPTRDHRKCMKRASKSCTGSAYVKFMLDHLKKIGCDTGIEEGNVLCEPCDGKLLGGFDPDRKEVVLCENTIYNQGCMDTVLTHELIHAYDYCRVNYEKENLKHLACTEIRAANLSGDCFFWKENFARFNLGWRGHQQECVKERATKSILCVHKVSEETAKQAVEDVFEACFNDTAPFERIPP